jgi:hypothetical protein
MRIFGIEGMRPGNRQEISTTNGETASSRPAKKMRSEYSVSVAKRIKFPGIVRVMSMACRPSQSRRTVSLFPRDMLGGIKSVGVEAGQANVRAP